MTWRFSNWLWRLLPGAASAALVAILFKLSLLASLERTAYHGLFRVRGAQEWDERLILVAIDEKSIEALGRFPWPRQRHIELLDAMAAGNPSVVAFDLIWSESSDDDDALAGAIANYSPVILAQARDTNGRSLGPVRPLQDVATLLGHVLYAQDPDGVVRHIEAQANEAPAFSLAALQVYSFVQAPVNLPPLEKPLWLNWVGPASTLNQVSFVDVIQGKVPEEIFQGKIVLVGVTATGFDTLVTPFDYGALARGIYLQATAIDNGLQESFLQPVGVQPDNATGFLILIGLAGPIISSLLSGRRARLQMAMMLGLNMSWCLLSVAFFWQDIWLPVAAPILLVGTTTAAVFVSEEIRENALLKRQIEKLWQTYHDDLKTLDGRLIEPVSADPTTIGQAGSVAHRILQLTTLADQLGRSQSAQTAIARSLPIGLIAADISGRVWFCNPQAADVLNIQLGAELSRHLIPTWMTQKDWHSIIHQLQAGKSPTAHEVLFNDQWFEMRWQPLAYRNQLLDVNQTLPQHQGFLFFLEDITSHKQVEAILREAKEAAESANRAKSNFLANMSHELRTPLNAVLGFSELMVRDSSVSLQHQDYLDVISRSGRHLLSLINNVLDMAKIESGQIELQEQIVDLHNLLDELQRMLSLKADHKRIYLDFERQPNVPKIIKADGGKLRQILLNLLGNAIKFTPAGHVRLRVQAAALSSDSASQPNCRLHFEVEDTGPGINEQEIHTLFQPFEQTSTGQEAQEGTGLGLAISRQYVQLMGGDIAVDSTVGEGTIFRFNIQVEAAQTAADNATLETPMVTGLAPGQPAYRLLVVEDQADSRQFLTTLLNDVGFQVWEARNGLEGLRQFAECKPHIVLMDIRMPIMDGYEAIRRVRSLPQGRDAIILAVTGSVFNDERAAILAAGCNDLIMKPVQPEILFAKLADYAGIQYTYRVPEEDTVVATIAGIPSKNLQAEDLQIMPDTWIAELHLAAIECRDNKINALIDQIPSQHAHLSGALKHLTDDFQFDTLIELTRSSS